MTFLRLNRCKSSQGLAVALVDGKKPSKTDLGEEAVMGRCYKTGDDRWLIVMMPFRHAFYWPKLARALGRLGWISDTRRVSAATCFVFSFDFFGKIFCFLGLDYTPYS